MVEIFRMASGLCLTLAVLALPRPAHAEERPPNFIIVLADDLGIGDIGPYGAEMIATPNLDRMAAEGITLTDFYAAANICTPSRGALLTGRLPIRLDLVGDVARPQNKVGLAPEEVTIAESLGSRSYATALIGKWHLGSHEEHWPTRQGFDYYYGLPHSNDMKPLALYRMSEAIEDPVDQTTLTERYTGEAVRFIEEHRDEPFFLYLAHTMPHVPLFVSEKFEGQSQAGLYGDVVETIDWSMGEIFAALERTGIDDNTLVIFTSDNGPWWEGSAGNYRGRKGESWEGGMRVPMIARWPGKIAAGTRSNAIASNMDFYPTLMKLAGVGNSGSSAGIGSGARLIDGRDISGVLMAGDPTPHEFLYLFNGPQISAVRTQDWKLVVRSYYKNFEFAVGSKAYYYHPGLLFDMERSAGGGTDGDAGAGSGGGRERYSFARENPEAAERLAGYVASGNADLVEPFREAKRKEKRKVKEKKR